MRWFSFDPEVHQPRPQMACYLTRTTADTHRLIRENLKETPIYGGWVDSKVGPCSSRSCAGCRLGLRVARSPFASLKRITP